MNPMPLLGADYQRAVRRAHDNLNEIVSHPSFEQDPSRRSPSIRPDVLDSWRRSLSALPDPAEVRTRIAYESDQLAEARRRHPFHDIMPLLQSHLIEPAKQAGMLVALGDAAGCLLWVEGERMVRNRAESMGFLPGTDWSEDVMGTSAPALALRSGSAVQISRAEHFAAEVHPWSCSAVPVTHPATGEVIGIIDVTGGDDAVSALVLPLLASTARAAGESLSKLSVRRASDIHLGAAGSMCLQVSGPTPRLSGPNGIVVELTGRHAEILLLLHQEPGGTTSAGLADALWPGGGSEVTVRAEIARLRRAIAPLAEVGLGVDARPYRLRGEVDSDIARMRRALERRDIEAALESCAGPVLPDSDAPGVREIHAETDALLRESLLQHGTWRQLWRFANTDSAHDDYEVLMAVLRLAPPEAVERDSVVLRLETLGY